MADCASYQYLVKKCKKIFLGGNYFDILLTIGRNKKTGYSHSYSHLVIFLMDWPQISSADAFNVIFQLIGLAKVANKAQTTMVADGRLK